MIRIRTAAAFAGVTLLGAAAVALALPARSIPEGLDPYAPSFVATTAENPPRWAILENGVKWHGTDPYVVCVLNGGARTTRTVPIDTPTWRTSSPMAWAPGANCPG